MSTGTDAAKIKSNPENTTVPNETNQNPSTSSTTETTKMDKISQTIFKSAIEAILLLTIDNHTLWKNRFKNVLNLQDLLEGLTSPKGTLTKSA
ncbi:hypothetical protein PCASD_14494 [Puccinia coronata f. sp. avenae]|uniref:Uncharacterized protein n=1 Tax=Puccinia coronata f. sp. avenae TaxID=200324 RepID=A0A2N5TF84_9BASI|nr:hypothetical protein PCASD_14494 [Puccinia coronata f. sp. avenae]